MEKAKIIQRIEELEQKLKTVKGTKCIIYSRIVGYFSPIENWNEGKTEEFKQRVSFEVDNGRREEEIRITKKEA